MGPFSEVAHNLILSYPPPLRSVIPSTSALTHTLHLCPPFLRRRYCGGVGRHVEDAGLQFCNLVLPVPSVWESELPNLVEW